VYQTDSQDRGKPFGTAEARDFMAIGMMIHDRTCSMSGLDFISTLENGADFHPVALGVQQYIWSEMEHAMSLRQGVWERSQLVTSLDAAGSNPVEKAMWVRRSQPRGEDWTVGRADAMLPFCPAARYPLYWGEDVLGDMGVDYGGLEVAASVTTMTLQTHAGAGSGRLGYFNVEGGKCIRFSVLPGTDRDVDIEYLRIPKQRTGVPGQVMTWVGGVGRWGRVSRYATCAVMPRPDAVYPSYCGVTRGWLLLAADSKKGIVDRVRLTEDPSPAIHAPTVGQWSFRAVT
jgi:hypothetical protein